MNFLNSWQVKLHDYFLKKEQKKQQIDHQSINLEVAKSIGILFEANQLEDKTTVLSYVNQLRKEGKTVKLLAYVNTSQELNDFSFHTFTKKELDWALRPKSEEVKNFINQQFDILINLSNSENIPLAYIAALSKAQFRVGAYTEKTFCYDLMIDTSDKQDLKFFIKQISFFLNKMKNDYEVKAT